MILIIKNAKAIGLIFVAASIAGWAVSKNIFGYSKDYYWYDLFYTQALNYSEIHFFQYEPGFVLLNYLGNSFGLGFDDFLGVLVFFSLSFKLWIISKGRYAVLASVIYFILIFWLHELTQIRLSLSLGAFYYSIYLLSNGKKIESVLMFILSSCFHLTAIFYLPVLLIGIVKGNQVSLRYGLIFIFVSMMFLLIAVYNVSGFHQNADAYMVSGDRFSIFSFRNFPLLFVLFGFYFFPRVIYEGRLYFLIFLNGAILSMALSELGMMANRIFEFSIFSIIIIFFGSEFLKKRTFIPILFLFVFSVIVTIKYIVFDGGYFNSYVVTPN